MSVEKGKAKESILELEIAQMIIMKKKKEVQQAIQTRLELQEEVAILRAELEASRAEEKALVEAVIIRSKAEKAVEEEFGINTYDYKLYLFKLLKPSE